MTTTSDTDVLAMLDEFLTRWNNYDIDGVLELFTDDVVFDASSGDEPVGKRYIGKDQARVQIQRVIAALPGHQMHDGTSFVHGDTAIAQWTMTHTAADGEKISVRGLDVFKIRDGKIAGKDSYRKHRPGAEYREPRS